MTSSHSDLYSMFVLQQQPISLPKKKVRNEWVKRIWKEEVMSKSCKIADNQQNRIKMKCLSSSINLSHLSIVGKKFSLQFIFNSRVSLSPLGRHNNNTRWIGSIFVLEELSMRHQTKCREWRQGKTDRGEDEMKIEREKLKKANLLKTKHVFHFCCLHFLFYILVNEVGLLLDSLNWSRVTSLVFIVVVSLVSDVNF